MRAASNRVSSFILYGAVAAAPFPFGSTDPIAIAFWCVVLGLGVISASPQGLSRHHFPLLGLAAIVILGYVVVLHEQLAVRPWIASPHELWRETADLLGVPIPPVASIARNQPFFSLGAPLANVLALVCSFTVCSDRYRARRLLLVVAWSGAAYAVYGLATYLLDPTYVLWREKIEHRYDLTATFTNRNTAAVYFGSCAVLWLLLLSERLPRRSPVGGIDWRSLFHRLLNDRPGPIALALAMGMLCLGAMLATSSRAGIVLSLTALIGTFAMYFRRESSWRGGAVVTLICGALLALLLLHVFGGNVSGRFDMQGLSGEGRTETYRSTLEMIADHPWFGTGLGTFAWSFPGYRSAAVSLWGTWDRAHSTPLELASDLGLPLVLLLVLAWIIVFIVLIYGIRRRRRDLILPVAAFMIAALSLAHSAVDFSLQIPGYSLVVFALVGAGLAQSFSSSGRLNT